MSGMEEDKEKVSAETDRNTPKQDTVQTAERADGIVRQLCT